MASVAACASSPLEDPRYRAQVARIRIYESDETLPPGSKVVGTVKGTSCKRNLYSTENPKESQAMLQVKLGAARLNANAVTNVVCEDQGTSFRSNCGKSVVCYADAVVIPASAPGSR